MQRKRTQIEYLVIVFLCLVFLSSAIPKAHSEEFQNVGLNDMPSVLKQRFPVCDKQLVVNWISPEKYQGYSEYDTYNHHGRYIDRFKAFVNLGGASLTYKLVAYYPKDQHDGKQGLIQSKHRGDVYYPYFPEQWRLVGDNWDELYALVRRQGLFYLSSGLYSDEQSKTVSQIVNWIERLTLTNNTKTVCVVYPDEKSVWLAERKAIKYTHTKEQIDVLYGRLKKLFDPRLLRDNPEAHRHIFETISSYDLNNDGVDDYFFDYMAILSVKKHDGSVGYQERDFARCATTHILQGDSQITTNGKEFFSEDCNISRPAK